MKYLVLVILVACGSSSPKKHEAPHQHHGGMPHRFENADQWAKVFDDPKRDSWQQPDRVITALELGPAMTVADIGAGTGYFAVKIAPLVKEVIATDVEHDMVRYIEDRATREGIKNIRARHTPPDDPLITKVDRVLVVDVWHHLGDRRAYAKKLATALNPGGFVAVVDFKLDATMGPPKQHRLAPEEIIADLAAA
ncbi:MAG: class I SAM-dependent methyltransferase, partial [Deltaproteobacteria bacterium]|nr:class I SAM-dependent methyltransferase [Deltaproteobacteria bacterium]